jgi:hypothetical protein
MMSENWRQRNDIPDAQHDPWSLGPAVGPLSCPNDARTATDRIGPLHHPNMTSADRLSLILRRLDEIKRKLDRMRD